eukprot:jgi/Chrzof1/4841/Cz15g01070.t1
MLITGFIVVNWLALSTSLRCLCIATSTSPTKAAAGSARGWPHALGIDCDHLFTQDRGPTVWVESHVVRGAGSPNSTSPTPGHDTH